jgi:hypothetical protein
MLVKIPGTKTKPACRFQMNRQAGYNFYRVTSASDTSEYGTTEITGTAIKKRMRNFPFLLDNTKFIQ